VKLRDAPEAAPVNARELKTQAVSRVLQRRTRPVYRDVGETRVQISGGDGFAAPATLAEFCDDVIARAPLDAIGSTLVVIMEASRGGARTGATAVAAAARLAPWDQWSLYGKVASLDNSKLPAAAELVRELVREFRRLKLQVTPPGMPVVAEKPGYRGRDVGPLTDYAPSVPDEMRLPGRGRVNG
jgi:hypothetical protein